MLRAFKDPEGRVCSNKSKPLWSHCGVCWDRDLLIISFCDHVFQILTEGQNTDEPTNILNMRSQLSLHYDLEELGEGRREWPLQLRQIQLGFTREDPTRTISQRAVNGPTNIVIYTKSLWGKSCLISLTKGDIIFLPAGKKSKAQHHLFIFILDYFSLSMFLHYVFLLSQGNHQGGLIFTALIGCAILGREL